MSGLEAGEKNPRLGHLVFVMEDDERETSVKLLGI